MSCGNGNAEDSNRSTFADGNANVNINGSYIYLQPGGKEALRNDVESSTKAGQVKRANEDGDSNAEYKDETLKVKRLSIQNSNASSANFIVKSAMGLLIVALLVAYFAGDSQKSTSQNWNRIQELQDELVKPQKEVGLPRFSDLFLEYRKLRGCDNLGCLLLTVEYEIHLGTGREDESYITLRNFISSSESYSVHYVRELAGDLRRCELYVRALILYRISDDLFQPHDLPPDYAVTWLNTLILSVSFATTPLIEDGGKSRDIGIKHGLEFMEDLLNELRTVKGASPDKKALNEANSLNTIIATCNTASFYHKSIHFGEEGLSVLENQFGVDASSHMYYGWLWYNFGKAQFLAGYYANATLCYSRSLEAYEKATDCKNDGNILAYIERSKTALACVCGMDATYF